MKHSTGTPTKYEQDRLDAMIRLGCVACAHLKIPYADIEVHHLLSGGKRMGHWFTIPLCAGHHQGDFTRLQKELIPRKKLVAISSGSKAFNKAYPTQRELWERVQKRLGLPAVWPTSKVMDRRLYVASSEGLVSRVPRVDVLSQGQSQDAGDVAGAGGRSETAEGGAP